LQGRVWHCDMLGLIGCHGDGFASPCFRNGLVLTSDLAETFACPPCFAMWAWHPTFRRFGWQSGGRGWGGSTIPPGSVPTLDQTGGIAALNHRLVSVIPSGCFRQTLIRESPDPSPQYAGHAGSVRPTPERGQLRRLRRGRARGACRYDRSRAGTRRCLLL
jgi:hypothetical protein